MTGTITTSPARSSRRRALVPLATLLAAVTLAMASGATFTSESENPANIYETGSLEQTNSLKDEAIFDLENLKPGDSVTGTVTIANSGSLDSTFKLTETVQANTFAQPALLTLVVTENGAEIYNGRLGALGTIDLGDDAWEVDEERTYTFTAKLDETANNDNQNKRAETTYTWNGTQTAGTHTDQ